MREAPVKAPITDGAKPLSKMWRIWFADLFLDMKTCSLQLQESVPNDPAPGEAVVWMNGDSDLMVKITSPAGVTKTATLVDFSSL